MFLKDKADLAYSKLADIPSLKCYLKPEACTFLWVLYSYYIFLILLPFYYFEKNLLKFLNHLADPAGNVKLSEH